MQQQAAGATATAKTARPASGRSRTSSQQQQVPPLPPHQQQQFQAAAEQQHDQPAASARRSLEAAQPEVVYMHSIISKLQLLNYEREFCKRKKPHRKGLTPCYFAAAQPASGLSISGNEQYFYFSSLATWLLQQCGSKVALPKEHDDPNVTLTLILTGLRELGFAPPSYPHTKLLAGWGPEVCALLDGLLDAALEARGLTRLPKTTFGGSTQDGCEEEAVVEEDVTQDDDAADITSQAAAALLAAQDSGSDDGAPLAGILRSSAVGEGAVAAAAAAAAEAASPARQVLVSTVDPVAWKLEVERVAPKLRVAVAPDMRDWRQHLEAAHAHMATLAASWPDVRSQLEQLSGEVCGSLEKLEGREQQLSGQFNGLLEQYWDARQQLTDMQAEFSRRTELISERNNELHRVAAALEDAKQQLEARGSNLTDASPLVRLKAAMASLREELKGMELRIGVVSHNLMSLSLQDKQLALQDAAKRSARDVTSGKMRVGA